jgi:Mg2+ and Co2+ transporter CorA
MLTKQQLDLIDDIENQIAAIEDGTLDLNGNETLTDRLMDLSCQLLSIFRLIRMSK